MFYSRIKNENLFRWLYDTTRLISNTLFSPRAQGIAWVAKLAAFSLLDHTGPAEEIVRIAFVDFIEWDYTSDTTRATSGRNAVWIVLFSRGDGQG